VCISVVRCAVQQRVFLYESYVKCGSDRNLVVNFPGTQFKAQRASLNILRKWGPRGDFWTRNLLKRTVYLYKINQTKWMLGWNTPRKLLRRLAQETDISKSSATRDTTLQFCCAAWLCPDFKMLFYFRRSQWYKDRTNYTSVIKVTAAEWRIGLCLEAEAGTSVFPITSRPSVVPTEPVVSWVPGPFFPQE
jgi:hypothetical protein